LLTDSGLAHAQLGSDLALALTHCGHGSERKQTAQTRHVLIAACVEVLGHQWHKAALSLLLGPPGGRKCPLDRLAHASTPRTRNPRHRAFMPWPSSERLRPFRIGSIV
jgi:hypothetical protein